MANIAYIRVSSADQSTECVYDVQELDHFLAVEILKGRVPIRLTAPYTEERRRKLSEKAKKSGFKSKSNQKLD